MGEYLGVTCYVWHVDRLWMTCCEYIYATLDLRRMDSNVGVENHPGARVREDQATIDINARHHSR